MTAPGHVCEEFLELHCIDFHDNFLVIEMSQSLLEQSNHYSQPPLQPPPIRWVIHSYGNAVNWISIKKSKKVLRYVALFADSISKDMTKKVLKRRVKDVEIHLKLFPSAKASQLNHDIIPTLKEYKYDFLIIHVGINDILRNKNDTHMNNLPGSILEMANFCQNCNIGKIFI